MVKHYHSKMNYTFFEPCKPKNIKRDDSGLKCELCGFSELKLIVDSKEYILFECGECKHIQRGLKNAKN